MLGGILDSVLHSVEIYTCVCVCVRLNQKPMRSQLSVLDGCLTRWQQFVLQDSLYRRRPNHWISESPNHQIHSRPLASRQVTTSSSRGAFLFYFLLLSHCVTCCLLSATRESLQEILIPPVGGSTCENDTMLTAVWGLGASLD